MMCVRVVYCVCTWVTWVAASWRWLTGQRLGQSTDLDVLMLSSLGRLSLGRSAPQRPTTTTHGTARHVYTCTPCTPPRRAPCLRRTRAGASARSIAIAIASRYRYRYMLYALLSMHGLYIPIIRVRHNLNLPYNYNAPTRVVHVLHI